MFKETFWYPVNYAHISAADYSLIKSSFQQITVLVFWFPETQGRTKHQALTVGLSCSFKYSALHPNGESPCHTPSQVRATATALRATKQTEGPTLEEQPFPRLLLYRDDSFSISQLRLTAKKPEFIGGFPQHSSSQPGGCAPTRSQNYVYFF